MKNVLTKVSTSIWTASALSQLWINQAFAKLPDPPGVPGLNDETGTDGIIAAIVKLIGQVLDFVLIVAVAFVVVAGIRLIISGGDEGEKDKAKKTIIYVIAGIIVVLLARVIVTFANDILSA